MILASIGRGLAAVGAGIASLFRWIWSKSAIAGVAVVAIAVLGVGIAVDSVITSNSIYKGVKVGGVDLSGMTQEAAAKAIDDAYSGNLGATSIYIFSDEDARDSIDLESHLLESESLAEQISFEEAQRNKKLWITSASDLEAKVPSEDLAKMAFDVGRKDGFGSRLGAFFLGHDIPVAAHFDEILLGNLISDINATLGSPVKDYGIDIEDDGIAITEGNVGYVLDDETFSHQISDNLLHDDSPIVSMVADVQYTTYNIDWDSANRTREAVQTAIPQSVFFNSEGETYHFSRDDVMKWISTKPEQINGSWILNPYIDKDVAKLSILSAINHENAGNVKVSIFKEDDRIYVQPDGEVAIPNVEAALDSLDTSLFSGFRSGKDVTDHVELDDIPIDIELYNDRFTLTDALSYGLVERFSVFTTNYTNTSSTLNRTFNIHLAADRIGSSIATANGGLWSFNEIAGACDEQSGFREAGVIESGEYTTGIGGGICQVATTVFNAAYNAGLPIEERHNHTLYSSSYPAGLDAAIAFPTYDLIWRNDTQSDILLMTSYTDTSITVSLVGTNPHRVVVTDTGEWVDGEKHKTNYEVDKKVSPNVSYVKTAGTDGMQISVTRIVKDDDGNVLLRNNFYSSYSPITRVIVYGEGTDLVELKKKYAEDDTKKKRA